MDKSRRKSNANFSVRIYIQPGLCRQKKQEPFGPCRKTVIRFTERFRGRLILHLDLHLSLHGSPVFSRCHTGHFSENIAEIMLRGISALFRYLIQPKSRV